LIRSSRHVEADGFVLEVVLETVLAELSADAGLLEATERSLLADRPESVDKDLASLNLLGGNVSGVPAFSVDGTGEAIVGVVGNRDALFDGLELDDVEHGSKDFLSALAHAVVSVGENGGLNEESISVNSFASDDKFSAGLLADVNVAHDFIGGGLRDLRSHKRALLVPGTNWHLAGQGDESVDKSIVGVLLHQHAGRLDTELTRVAESLLVGVQSGFVQIGVVEDNEGTLSAELKSDSLDMGSTFGHDRLTDSGRSGESDLSNAGVVNDSFSSFGTKAGHHVDDTGNGAFHFSPELTESQGGERSVLGNLEDTSATGGEERSHLPGRHEEGEVPGGDDTTDTDRLSTDVVELVRVVTALKGLAVNALSEASVVSKAGDSKAHFTS